jgi:hypothetical protein
MIMSAVKLPEMKWAAHWVCPAGHFYDPTGKAHDLARAWIASFCQECSKVQFGWNWNPERDGHVFYTRQEWSEGQVKLWNVAVAINSNFAGKKAQCDICNKIIAENKDKAYHLQSHFKTAITEAESHFLKEVSA